MARLILPNFEYQPNDTRKLNWDEAPPAPDNFRCFVVWDYKDWDKSYEGLVWAAEIRDELFDLFGVFGTFRTPVLLDPEGFRKLCFLIAGHEDLRDYADGKYNCQSFVTTKLPKNYLPFDKCENPGNYAREQFFERRGVFPSRESMFDNKEEDWNRALHDVNSKRSNQNELFEDDLFLDDAGHLVRTNDQVRLVNYPESELNGTIGTVYYIEPDYALSKVKVYMPSNCGGTFMSISIHNLRKCIPLVPPKLPKHIVDWSKMPPERKRQTDQEAVSLCDLSTDVKQHIASYLPLFDVKFDLRRACRDTFWNFSKPPPDNLEYDFVYFSVTTFDYSPMILGDEWHGVAHTTNDVLVAIWNHDWRRKNFRFTLKFVKFDRNYSIVPLLRWQTGHFDGTGFLDPRGHHYCGVRQASDVRFELSYMSLERIDDRFYFEDADDICAVFRHC